MELLKKGEVFVASWVDPEDALPDLGKDYGTGITEEVIVHLAMSPGVDFGEVDFACYDHKNKVWVGRDGGKRVDIRMEKSVREYMGYKPDQPDHFVTHWMRKAEPPFIVHPNAMAAA